MRPLPVLFNERSAAFFAFPLLVVLIPLLPVVPASTLHGGDTAKLQFPAHCS